MIHKQTVVFILPSVHHVLKGEKVLKRTEVFFDLIPVPKEINPECGMAIETSKENARQVFTLLTEAKLPVEHIYHREGKVFTTLSSTVLE